jgi:hypothetical protein
MATARQAQQFPCITCPLLACEGLRPPDPEQRAWLQAFKAGEIRVAKGDTVLAQGAWSTGVFTLLSGMLVRYRLLETVGGRSSTSCSPAISSAFRARSTIRCSTGWRR